MFGSCVGDIPCPVCVGYKYAVKGKELLRGGPSSVKELKSFYGAIKAVL